MATASRNTPTTTTTTTPETLNINLLRSGTCKSLEGRGTLDYEIGTDDSGTLLWRISRNSGGGFFSDEWVPFSTIRSALEQWPLAKPMTSLALRCLFKGKSANNPSFLLATLLAEGVVKLLEGKRRQYEVDDLEAFLSSVTSSLHSKKGQGSATAKRKTSARMTPATKASKPQK